MYVCRVDSVSGTPLSRTFNMSNYFLGLFSTFKLVFHPLSQTYIRNTYIQTYIQRIHSKILIKCLSFLISTQQHAGQTKAYRQKFRRENPDFERLRK